MSLYKHVANKDALLDGVRELLLSELADASPAGDDWTVELLAFAHRYRALGRAHPEAFSLLARGADRAYVAGRASAEAGLQSLLAAGFDDETAAYALRSVVRYVLGFSLIDMAGDDAPAPLPPCRARRAGPGAADGRRADALAGPGHGGPALRVRAAGPDRRDRLPGAAPGLTAGGRGRPRS